MKNHSSIGQFSDTSVISQESTPSDKEVGIEIMDSIQGNGPVLDPFEREYVYNKPRKFLETVNEDQAAELRFLRDSWTWKDDDVIVATFPRSGTHLSWVMARYILQGSTKPILDPVEQSLWFTFGLRDIQKGRRAIGTHYHAADFPKSFWKDMKKRKCFVVVRNVKDLAWSYYNLLKNLMSIVPDLGTWEKFIQKFCAGETPHGSWFTTIRSWEEFSDRHPELPIMMLYFEDMVRDLPGTVRKMAHFMDCPISDGLVQEIAVKCGFDEMRQLPMSDTFKQILADSESTSENVMYRKGEVGDWKNHFTVHQNELIETAYEKNMKGSTYRFRYE